MNWDRRRARVATVADLRHDDFIDSQQGALAKVRVLGIRVGVSRRCARGFAVEISSVVIAATINYLSSKPGEQCLRPFRAINHMKLAFGLRADDALFEVFVASKCQRRKGTYTMKWKARVTLVL